MGMQVDEAGHDDLPGHIDDFSRLVGREVTVHGGDPAVGDTDIESTALVAAGIDDLTAGNEQVEVHVSILRLGEITLAGSIVLTMPGSCAGARPLGAIYPADMAYICPTK
jgi:hypothetical protein